MQTPNKIERELILNADIETVWDAITNPEKLSQWFGDLATIDTLAEGESITFGWDNDICKGVIQTVDKPHVFAFRWQSSRLGKTANFQEEYSTLVTFTLSSVPTGTHLHMIETGFASLPDEVVDETTTSPTIVTANKVLDSEQPLSVLNNPVQEPVDSPDLTAGTAKLSPTHGEQAYQDNVSGWNWELKDLKKFVEQDS